MKGYRFLLAAAMIIGLVAPGEAAPLQFFGQNEAGVPHAANAEAAFLANLVGVGSEGFEGFEFGTGATIRPLELTFPGVGTARFNAPPDSFVAGGSGFPGVHPIAGSQLWQTNGDVNIVVIDFVTTVAAIGFYVIDAGDVGAQLMLALVGSSGSVVINIPNNGRDGNVLFFGYIDADNPWTRAVISDRCIFCGDIFGLDELTVASVQQVISTPIPEPSTLSLLGLGVFGLVVATRRYRRC